MDRRSRTWRFLAGGGEVSLPGPGEGTEVIDGLTFDYRRERRCRVCEPSSASAATPNAEEVRKTVDRMLVAGAIYAAILRAIAPLVAAWPENRRPGYHSIRRHQLRHLPVDVAAVREILERRALDQGLQIAVGDGPIVTRAAILEVVRNRGFEALAAGELSPTLADTLHAAEVLEQLDREAGSHMTAGELAGQIRVFVEVVKAHVPEQTWNEIVQNMVAEGSSPSGALPAEGKEQEGNGNQP